MFFGLTSLLTIFQAIMNDRDIIEIGNVVVFIDGVMIGTEIEKGYNKIVEEVLRRMAENNLFVKPEKYVWKVRKVGFLGVIIRLDSIRIEKKRRFRE